MDPSSPAPRGDELLVHGRFLRALARALVGDAERAEDLVQDTWTRALEHPPRHGAAPRAWLARILRRLAAKKGLREGERGAREDRAAREQPAHESDEPSGIVAEIELSRRVLEVVERLREPYRSTLYLRYYRGLAPELVAGEQRVPVKTVKTRLARGLELVRADLDRQHGGRRESWVALLLPLCGAPLVPPLSEPSTTALPLGPALVPALSAAALVLAVAAAAGTLWLARDGARSSAADPAPRASAGAVPPARVADASVPVARSVMVAPRAPPAVPAGVRLRGRVLDPEGAPVAGAEISGLVLEPEGRGAPFRRALAGGAPSEVEPAAEARTHSDASGVFELVLARPGLARLGIERDGFAPIGRKALLFLGQDLDLGNLVLEPGVVLEGRVLDEDRQPVAGVELWQERLDEGLAFGPGTAQPVCVGLSDADGRFELRRQAVGEWRIEAHSSLYAPAALGGSTQQVGERAAELEFVLARGGRLRGHVLGLDPAELERVRVVARVAGESEPSSARVRRAGLDAHGAFELGGFAEGAELELLVVLEERDEPRRGGLRARPQRVRAGPDEILLYAERAEPGEWGAEVTGESRAPAREPSGVVDLLVLRPDGSPAAGALVALRADARGEMRRHPAGTIRAADGAGRLRWTGLAPGAHEFRALAGVFGLDASGADAGAWQAVELDAEGLAELALQASPAAELTGRVRIAGLALAGATLLLRPATGDGARGPEPALVVQSDAEGCFAFHALAPGRYRLELFHALRALPEVRVLELPQGTSEIVLELGEARARGVVRAADGSPLAGALVRALAEDERPARDAGPLRPAPSATTDATGRFELAGLEPGRPVRLAAALAGYAARPRAAQVPEAFQELELEPEARLELELVCAEAPVLLLRALGPQGQRRQVGVASGRVVSLAELTPGAWTLELVESSSRGPREDGPFAQRTPLAQRTLELAPGANELLWRVP